MIDKFIRYKDGKIFACLLGVMLGFFPALFSTNAAIIFVPMVVLTLSISGNCIVNEELIERFTGGSTYIQRLLYSLSFFLSLTGFWALFNHL